jgi:Protein of unknown function (DUF2851)
MKEDFLHHVWQFKKFNQLNLSTVQGEALQVLHPGQYLQLAGPDFFNAQVVVGNQKWAGNVEIHLKSSDWYLHHHETDANYDNVILHVVWEHDTEVLRKDGTEIPVFELKNHVEASLVGNYTALAAAKTWINCEKELASLNSFTVANWKERLFLERLERKALPILQLAKDLGGDWEAVLCCFLAKNFGLNTNGQAFFELVRSVPFSILRKESFESENIEALLFGRAGLLNDVFEDLYAKDLQQRYAYILHKHRLENAYVTHMEFFRHRPDNFPTIRLSQFGQLYHNRQNLFSKIIETNSLQAIYDVFDVQAAPYWNTHYRFDKESTKKRKPLSKSFIDLLVINTIVPFKFAYAKAMSKEITEELLALMQLLSPESNTVMDKFKHFKMVPENAYDTQALLQLKNEYCNYKRCMQCAFGLEILKR